MQTWTYEVGMRLNSKHSAISLCVHVGPAVEAPPPSKHLTIHWDSL